MSEYGLPIFYALFIWWFSTGLIVYLDGLPRATFRWSMIGASVISAIALYGLYATRADTTVAGAFIAFTCGLVVWGWQEMAFLMGYITGPRKRACPPSCGGWRHFVHGVQALLYHEISILITAACIAFLTLWEPNQTGFWTFMILWLMRISTKLNIFLGVRNVTEEFLPNHLAYLKSFFRVRWMNPLFPVSITISTVVCVLMAEQALATEATPFEVASFTFLSFLLALAILEHWFLVLPIPATALWNWALRSHQTTREPFQTQIAPGFSGSGKTTWRR